MTGTSQGRAACALSDRPPIVEAFQSFEEFYGQHYRNVAALAFALTASPGAAEELAQDAFIAAYRNWNQVARLDKPVAWVRRVVSNRSVSRFRRAVAEAKAFVRHGGTGRSTDDADLAAAIDVWRAVRQLPRRQAQVVALTYLYDLSREETAEVLGLSSETVKTHLGRARRTLAAALSQGDRSP